MKRVSKVRRVGGATTRRVAPRGGAGGGVKNAAHTGRTVRSPKPPKQMHIDHLHRVEGQVRGIAAMVGSDRSCAEVIVQIAAVRESLRTLARGMLRYHLEHCTPEAKGVKRRPRREVVGEILALAEWTTR